MAPSGQIRVGRYLGALLVVFVVLYGLVFLTGDKKFQPRLGLDLQGGTTVTLVTRTADGKPPPAANLEEARQIIENRVNGLGVAEAEVVTEGNSNIVISVPGQNNDAVKQIGQPAELRFRQVLQSVADKAPAATPTPTPSGSASPSGSATPAGSASPLAPKPSAGSSAGATPSPSLGLSASPTASASASSAAIKEQKADKAEVIAKVGGQQLISQIQQLQDVTQLESPQAEAVLAPFGKLSPVEVAVLPVDVQFKLPQISCDQLNKRPAGSIALAGQQVVACEDGTKFLLDKAVVLGTDVKTASYDFNTSGNNWRVTLNFKGDGQDKWTNLTRKAFNAEAEDQKRVAIVLDNEVVSAPTIQGVISGQAEITGSFTEQQAKDLATKLKYGALPLTFSVDQTASISPTLGSAQLEAGLIAGGIGIALVIVYVLFYYRLLGLVTVASLVLSGLIIYPVLVLLGRPNTIGFTLTLAGIAGFIVSIGITADSFVVFFERLKDEIRDGRSPRSAVPRAWTRARRTILSADAVSFLAAAVLYFLAVGAVKGFAFTLGMSTVLDLIVVFLFTHPLVAMMSRSRTFMSPRISGLGRVNAPGDVPLSRPTATKEA